MKYLALIAALLLAVPAYAQQSPQPSSSPSIGITAVVSAAAEATHILKASPGNLYSVYVTNSSATAGFLMIFNATTAPADGAVTPLDCIPVAGTSTSGLNWAPGPPKIYSVGIVAVISSGANCFTKTTSGGVTGFFNGAAS